MLRYLFPLLLKMSSSWQPKLTIIIHISYPKGTYGPADLINEGAIAIANGVQF